MTLLFEYLYVLVLLSDAYLNHKKVQVFWFSHIEYRDGKNKIPRTVKKTNKDKSPSRRFRKRVEVDEVSTPEKPRSRTRRRFEGK